MQSHSIPLRITALRRQLLTAFSRHLKPLQLSPQQVGILRLIREGESNPSAFAERLMLDRPVVSRLLKSMRQAGWVVSQRSEEDARRDVVTLTPAGIAIFEKAEKAWETFRSQIEGPFSAAELASLHRLLTKLETVLIEKS